ncbi:hypothetical protein NQ315_005251 [Exocentrus adspersus]|uniref:Transmembrane protein 127 transmembrane region domain-containing protein n=1 Tax=Exocentrus adspersus TaxID=1586481 RepID=A0AAV8W207_9CUCU|nr:hypothetical protein NQ315_005251 [Exocentrus adspersus]
MAPRFLTKFIECLHPKEDGNNMISATFHAITITLISMSLVDLTWFKISDATCVPYLTLGQFFWFGFTKDEGSYIDYHCLNSTIVNMMRTMILLCFMSIIFALLGFFLDIIGPKSLFYRMVRKYAVLGTCTVLWIMAILSMSYDVVLLLEDSLDKTTSDSDTGVNYGLGVYLVGAAGGVSCLGIIYTLILTFKSAAYRNDDDICLIDESNDSLDTYNSPSPPPPYVPPPPYSP